MSLPSAKPTNSDSNNESVRWSAVPVASKLKCMSDVEVRGSAAPKGQMIYVGLGSKHWGQDIRIKAVIRVMRLGFELWGRDYSLEARIGFSKLEFRLLYHKRAHCILGGGFKSWVTQNFKLLVETRSFFLLRKDLNLGPYWLFIFPKSISLHRYLWLKIKTGIFDLSRKSFFIDMKWWKLIEVIYSNQLTINWSYQMWR